MLPRRASAAVLAACLLAASCVPVAAGEPTSGTVVKVYDGDTITIESDGARHKCRLLGIDAPEISYGRLRSEMEKVVKYAPAEARQELEAARRTFEKWAITMEARAREARDALAAMVNGRTVRLAYDSEQPRRDRYGRLLVYVAADELDVNAEMVRRGLAVADTRFPCARLEEYDELGRRAQAARLGLWARVEKSAGAKDSTPEPGAQGDGGPGEEDVAREGKEGHEPTDNGRFGR